MADKNSTIPKGWRMTTLGEIPESWQITTAEKFCLKVADGTHATPKPVLNGKYLVTSKHIKSGKVDLTSAYLISQDDFNEVNKRSKVDQWDILFSMIGTVGEIAIIDKNPDFAIKNVGLFKCGNEFKAKWLFYFLRGRIGQGEIQQRMNGTTQSYVTLSDLKSFPIIVPSSSDELKAIAAVLSSLDDKIELLREQNKTLEATAQTIFKEWFVNFNFPGATGKMIDSELGEIPEGWRVGGLIEDSISEFVKTNIDKFDGTKDYVETANVNLSNFVGNFEKITYEERASRANMQPVANSIWFARMAESRKYLLFQERDWQNIETKILSTGFAGIRCIKDYLYFYWCFILSNTFNNLKNQFAEGAVQVAISNEGIQRILLALPPKEIVQKFTETVSSCFEKISNNNSQIQTLSALRDTLLPKLMKGEVRVKGFIE